MRNSTALGIDSSSFLVCACACWCACVYECTCACVYECTCRGVCACRMPTYVRVGKEGVWRGAAGDAHQNLAPGYV